MSCLTPGLLAAAQRVLTYLHHLCHVGLRYEVCPDERRASTAIPTPIDRHAQHPPPAGCTRKGALSYLGLPRNSPPSRTHRAKPR
eukprot:2263482-Pleurochrysis_carterae.AAC.1